MHAHYMLSFRSGKYALCDTLPKKQQNALFELLDVLSIMWRKVLSNEEAQHLPCIVAEALHKFEQAFPASEMDIKMHNIMHLAHKLNLTGPFQSTYMFDHERNYKTLRHWMTQFKNPESTIMRTCVKHQHTLLWQAKAEYMELLKNSARGAPAMQQMAEMQRSDSRRLFDLGAPEEDGGEVNLAIPHYER